MTETNATRAAGSAAPACSAYRCNHAETCANAACAAMAPHEHNDDCRWHICEYLNTTVACDYVVELTPNTAPCVKKDDGENA